ncbi:unnamed protein product [Soboliphyme baturini]|uniref:Secreted protein n=1 Tax=Soboliphyme baturini TaxID=241478 RepID=A0A183ICG9_9BILA|nr:unnamed protein product [Soboliphyme baturini]
MNLFIGLLYSIVCVAVVSGQPDIPKQATLTLDEVKLKIFAYPNEAETQCDDISVSTMALMCCIPRPDALLRVEVYWVGDLFLFGTAGLVQCYH